MRRLLAIGALVLALNACGGDEEPTVAPVASTTTLAPADDCFEDVAQVVNVVVAMVRSEGPAAYSKMGGRYLVTPEKNAVAARLIPMALIFDERRHTQAEADAFWTAMAKEIAKGCDAAYPGRTP